MSNADKMLQLVLSDNRLSSFYDYNPNDFLTLKDALQAENAVVSSVAKIIKGISGSSEKSIQKQVYNDVFNHLNRNIL